MLYPHHPVADIFPLLPPEELQSLASDIRHHGLQEPVWLWKDENADIYLLDGRNRVAACEIAGVEPQTRWYSGGDPVSFVVSQNLHRRHLTAGQKAAVAAELEPLYAVEAAKRSGGRPKKGEGKPVAEPPPVKQSRKSRERAAKAVGVSGRGVSQFKRIVKSAPDLAVKVKAGDMPLDRAERIIRDREAETKRIETAKARSAAAPFTPRVEILEGDFRVVLADLKNVDAIITDPPYAAEFLPALGDLAKWADLVLKPDGVMAVLLGQSHLPEAYRQLSSGRPYRWTCCLLTEGPAYVSHARKTSSNWKPILVYGQGKRIHDVIRAEGDHSNAKEEHKWGQAYSGFHTLIEMLTDPENLICDPFMGGGTTLLAAQALGRHSVGCDIDGAAIAKARQRLQ